LLRNKILFDWILIGGNVAAPAVYTPLGLASPGKGLGLPMLLTHHRLCLDAGAELTAVAALNIHCFTVSCIIDTRNINIVVIL